MKDFKTIILDALGSIEWMYEKNAQGEYDPHAIYKGATCEIENVFHKAFADSLIEYRNEKMKNWKGWFTTGTLTTPAGVSSPFASTSSCSTLTNPTDINLAYTMRDAFKLSDPNMKFQHFNVFKAINDWLSSCSIIIAMDGSSNMVVNPAPFFPSCYQLLTLASAMEGEIQLTAQKEGFSMEDYWSIFSRYLDMAISTSIQAPVFMTGMFNGNMFNGTCTVVL